MVSDELFQYLDFCRGEQKKGNVSQNQEKARQIVNEYGQEGALSFSAFRRWYMAEYQRHPDIVIRDLQLHNIQLDRAHSSQAFIKIHLNLTKD